MYIGNCITILDQQDSPFADATEMAIMIEDSDSLPKREFLKNMELSQDVLNEISDTITMFGVNNNIFWAYSEHDDVHYFFTTS